MGEKEREGGGSERESLPSSFKMLMVVEDIDSVTKTSESVLDKVSSNISRFSRRLSAIISTGKHWELTLCRRGISVRLKK